MPFIRKNLVWIMLAFTLAAMVWVNAQEEGEANDLTSPTRRTRHEATVTPPQAPAPAAIPQQYRSKIEEAPQNLFPADEPPIAEPEEEIPSLPQMPGNPYVYAGKLLDQGNYTVFLTDGVKNHAVQIGDVLNNTWRVQAITPPIMTLEYLPLKSSVEMQIGVSS